MNTFYLLGDESKPERCIEPAKELAKKYPQFNITYGTINELPDDCGLLIADHLPMWNARVVEKYARAHPKTKVLLTRDFCFPAKLTKDTIIANVAALKREELLCHGLDWLMEQWNYLK